MIITTDAGTHARIKEMLDLSFGEFHKKVYGNSPRGSEWVSWVQMSKDAFNDALKQMEKKL